mgnify:CR=1 FL=1
MDNRQQRRRAERKALNAENSQHVCITVPVEFVDCMGGVWEGVRGAETFEMGFVDVLLATLRRCPVTDVESSERSLEILQTIRGTENGTIMLRRADYDWMLTQFRAHAHKMWTGPDAAHFRKVLEQSTTPQEKED